MRTNAALSRTGLLIRAMALAAALAGVAGCLGANNDQIIQPATATLDLTLTPPPGVDVQVIITGPQEFTKTIDVHGVTTADLEGLVPGDYAFSAPVVVVPTSLVDTVWSVPIPTAALTIAPGKTLAFAITYAVRPGSGSIWLTRFGDSRVFGGWPAAGLLVGTNPPAAEQILTSYEEWAGVAVDGSGGIWLLANDLSTSSLLYFAAEQLGVGQSQPMPMLLQPGGRLDAFCLDKSGGIWGASQADAKVYYWSAVTIASGNLLTPDVVVQGASGSLAAPTAVAFDSVGSLWVVNAPSSGAAAADANGSVARFVPRQLAASGYYLPTVQFPVASPSAMIFDSGGALWLITGGSAIAQYSTAQLGGSDATAPAISIALDADATATSMAFDALGDLWVTLTHSTDGSSALVMFSPGQLQASGAPTPLVALQTPAQAGAPSLVLIDPTPTGLPLVGAPQ